MMMLSFSLTLQARSGRHLKETDLMARTRKPESDRCIHSAKREEKEDKLLGTSLFSL